MGFVVYALNSYVSEGSSYAQFCVNNMGTADVAPCHTKAAHACTESSSIDMTLHRWYNCIHHLMTDIDLQRSKNSETLPQTQHTYHLLAERYSKISVLQNNINTLRPKTYEACTIPVTQPFFAKDKTFEK